MGSPLAVRRFVVGLVLVVLTTLLSSTAGATPPPPPPITGTHPWIAVLCKFTDLSTEPVTYTPSYFENMFGGAGSSSLDFVDWWHEISYDKLNVSGSHATSKWYSLGMTRYEWAGLSRFNKIRTCGSSTGSDVNYNDYYGIVAIFNDDSAPRAASTTLASGINSSDTTITVASSAGFPTPPFPVTIDDGSTNDLEELHVTAVSGTTWTVTRAYENFNPANDHSSGATINVMDGGDLGAADTGTHGINLGGTTYTLGLVVLPPQTNMGAAQHETGHGFGYSHSRKLSTATSDYNDCYDIMSFDSCNYNFIGDFGAAGVLGDPMPAAVGPGLDAINLDIQGWMPPGRTFSFSNGSCTQTTRDLAALNYPSATGDMEIRIPAALTIPLPGSGTTSTDYYTLELRDKSLWDRGIPQNSVLLHVHGLNGFSYWVDQFGGSAVGHSGALYLNDEFVDSGNNTYIAVNRMDTIAHTATVTLGACKVNTQLSYSGATTGDFNDQVTLAGDLTVDGTSVPIPSAPVTFTLGSQSCTATTNSSGHASCTITINQHPGSYTAIGGYAGDAVYNATTGSASFTITREESQVTYTGATTQHYHDVFTASGTLVDPVGGAPIAGKTVTFTLGVGDSCSGVTDGSGHASCSITPTQAAGTYSLTAAFAGDVDYVSDSSSASFAITREETTTTYIGPTVILQGASGVTLSARLVEDGSGDTDGDGGSPGPVPFGQTITLSLGSQSCTGTTNASGVASCTLTFIGSLGPQPLGANFAGDAYYQPSSDTSRTAIVFAFPSRGAFVLGDGTVALAGPTTNVTWWSEAWPDLNNVSGGTAPSSFKGFAGTVSSLPTTSPANRCGTSFTTRPGNSTPPTGGVPSYMGVIVANSVTKSGSTIEGTWGKIVVVITDPGYAPNPGHPGTGTIVATFCP